MLRKKTLRNVEYRKNWSTNWSTERFGTECNLKMQFLVRHTLIIKLGILKKFQLSFQKNRKKLRKKLSYSSSRCFSTRASVLETFARPTSQLVRDREKSSSP